jgi:beta-galactosidase
MYYGVAWYPEHKTEEEIVNDLRLIKESGINTVRIGEFAWSRFEPEPGMYCFDWLDPVIDELGKAGIKTILCTPTACPPAWMVKRYPDILYMDGRRIRRPFGGRRHYCYNNENFRSFSKGITEQIARRYGRHPHVAGFQIDNEPAQEGTGRCCCPVCASRFRLWLERKYGSIGEFNRRSGAVFWSQEYDSFESVNPPVNQIEPGAQIQILAYYENPTLRLDFERFASDSQIEYQNIQVDILRAHSEYPITTNATGLATNSIDSYESAKTLDCYAFDYYPGLRDAQVDSFPYAFARGVKEGRHFWVPEFVSGGGHCLGGTGRLQPNPGALKQAVVHSFAHGAGMMLHFQFRSFPFGAEQLNYAIVDQDGVPRRRYREMCETADLLKRLEPYQDAAFSNEAAILFDYDSHWALKIKPVNPGFSYPNFAGEFYRGLGALGIGADVLSLYADISRYKLVILPAAIVLAPELRPKFHDYVKKGGTILATFLTSVKNRDNVGYTESLPAGLTGLFGIGIDELEPVLEKNRAALSNGSFDRYWSELLSGPAEKMALYTGTYKRGAAVITKNHYGNGTAWYMGTGLDPEGLKDLLRDISAAAGLATAPFSFEDRVEVIGRVHQGRALWYIFNFTAGKTQVLVKDPSAGSRGEVQDLLSGKSFEGTIPLEANGFVLVGTV